MQTNQRKERTNPNANRNETIMNNSSNEQRAENGDSQQTGEIADTHCDRSDRHRERHRKVKLRPGEHLRIVATKAKGGANLIGVTAIYDRYAIDSILIEVAADVE